MFSSVKGHLMSVITTRFSCFFAVVTCPQLSNPPNGTVQTDTLSPQPYGTIVNITCTDGYRREGSDSRMCLSDGTWSGEETNCTCEYVDISYYNSKPLEMSCIIRSQC